MADAVDRYGAPWSDGVRLFEAAEYWECHEALEPAWLEAEGIDKHFLGGVILLAASLHKHRAMGSPRGGRRNYAKALAHLAHVPDAFAGVDVRELEARVHRALRQPTLTPTVPRGRERNDMTDPNERRDGLPHDHRRARRPQTKERLRRSPEGIIGGVAAGIAEFVGTQRNLVRWIFALSLPLTIGLSGVVYVLLWLLLPGPAPDGGGPRRNA